MRRRNFLTGVFAAAVTPNFARAKACIEKKAEFKEAANVDICVLGGELYGRFRGCACCTVGCEGCDSRAGKWVWRCGCQWSCKRLALVYGYRV